MDIKIPHTTGPVMDAITHRWSPRSFAERPLAETDVETILEAATWAFSASNEQPWRYVYGHRGTPLFDTLTGLLMPGNQVWAKNAAVLMVSLIQTHNAAGKPNTWAMHDLGAANFALMLQANALGIYGHVMGGFDQLRTVTELELPEGIAPVAMIALGYLDPAEKLPEPFLTRELAPRTRKPVSEIVLKKS